MFPSIITHDPYQGRRELVNKIKRKFLEESEKGVDFSKYRISTTYSFIEAMKANLVVVDKSELIRDLFNDRQCAVAITTPRRWGKSFNLDLIKAFCQLETDQNGVELPEDLKLNRFFFQYGAIDFKSKRRTHFKVMEDKAVVDEHFGRYIVVSLDLKNTFGRTFDDLRAAFATSISTLYSSFKFLMNSDKLIKADKKYFEFYADSATRSATELRFSLQKLCWLLYQHYDRKYPVLLLIDEYDSPFNYSLYNFQDDDIEKTRDLIHGLLGTVVNGFQPPVRLSILTGVLKLAKCASSFNNIEEFDILQRGYARYYGFTKEQVESLANLWFESNEIIPNLLREWYNGYKIRGDNTPIYNPFAVMTSLNKCIAQPQHVLKHFRSYWTESGQIDFLKPLFFNSSILSKLNGLLSSNMNKMTFRLIPQLKCEDMKEVYDLRKQQVKFDIDVNKQQILFSYLLFNGFFALESYDWYSRECVVRFPNLEIREHVKDMLKSDYYSKVN